MKMKRIPYLLLLTVCWLSGTAHAQSPIPISAKELAPSFGIRPQLLDDTLHVARYLDSLGGTISAMTDSCVTLNAKLLALGNMMLYDCLHNNDTVWVDAVHYIEDYSHYIENINTLSKFVLGRAHNYIDLENLEQVNLQQTALNQCKDTIDRQHRTIINTCEGIGISDKNRKKELKDIYYAYLSVYNRYDFSMKRSDSAYLASLYEFSRFQQNVIDNLLSNRSYAAKINNFANTLKVRCEKGHSEVLRSYQRTFRQPTPDVSFSSIKSYYEYINQLETIMEIQQGYMAVVDLREQIMATNKRINDLYYPQSREVAKTYQEVAAAVNMTPAFNNLTDAQAFILGLQEFTQVQTCYLQDFDRLSQIQAHGDTIVKRSGMRFSDVAKAYKQISSVNSMSPNYRTLDDAARFGLEMERFELLQRQYDTIILLRNEIDRYKDSISKGWMSHLTLYNGFQNIRKQFVFTPTFIDAAGGSDFIDQLKDCRDMELTCLNTIKMDERSKELNTKISSKAQSYRNIRKAYNTLEGTYKTVRNINHISDLVLYIQQQEIFVTVQKAVWEKLETDAVNTDKQLGGVKDIKRIETIFGL